MKNTINENEDRVKKSKDRIAAAKTKAESAKKNGQLSDEEYSKRMDKIKRAEELTVELEEKVNKGKGKIKQ